MHNFIAYTVVFTQRFFTALQTKYIHTSQTHKGGVFIHCIPGGRSYLDDPPSISEGWGGRITDYRIAVSTKLAMYMYSVTI